MSDQFQILVHGQQIRAELLDGQAPRICRAFRASLPLESFAVHAKFAGDELIVMVPFVADFENQVASVAPGDIGYYPSRQTLCLFYGDITPFASVSLFARALPEDLPVARAVGREVLANGARTVRITGGAAVPPPDRTAEREMAGADLLARLDAVTRGIWAREPADVTRLRAFSRPPMGNRPCVLYANFDLFWAGENLQTCLGLARSGQTPPAETARVGAALLRRTQNRLGKWEFADAVALLGDVATMLDGFAGSFAAEPGSLVALIEAVLLYVDRLQSWVDAIIPWARLDAALPLADAPAPPA